MDRALLPHHIVYIVACLDICEGSTDEAYTSAITAPVYKVERNNVSSCMFDAVGAPVVV